MKTVWFVLLAAFLNIQCSGSVLGQLEKLEDLEAFYKLNQNEIESRQGVSCRIYAYSSFTANDPEKYGQNKVMEQYVHLTEKNGVRRTDVAFSALHADVSFQFVRNDLVLGQRRLTTTKDGVVEIGVKGAGVSKMGGFWWSGLYLAEHGWPQCLVYSIATSDPAKYVEFIELKEQGMASTHRLNASLQNARRVLYDRDVEWLPVAMHHFMPKIEEAKISKKDFADGIKKDQWKQVGTTRIKWDDLGSGLYVPKIIEMQSNADGDGEYVASVHFQDWKIGKDVDLSKLDEAAFMKLTNRRIRAETLMKPFPEHPPSIWK